MKRSSALLAAGTVVAMASGTAAAQAPSPAFVPFTEFLAGLSPPPAEAMARAPSAAAQVAPAADAMRQHLLRTYGGVAVRHSFVQDGDTFDCVPVMQQPSVRQLGLRAIAAPPPNPPSAASPPAAGPRTSAATQPSPSGYDSFGNAQRCEAAAIPMRRVTLQEISRFGTLQKFFSKGPNGAAQVHVEKNDGMTPPSYGGHTYAHEYQVVNNYGGSSTLALFRPYVDTSRGEIFSLSQQWYVGGAGAKLQTAEVGWQNYPSKYGSENPVLFIYWTADDYNQTGCYNLECAAFVQTNTSWRLGAPFAHYSVVSSTQYDLALGFYLHGGNWWLAVNNTWIGYYPATLYRGGQLSRYAQIFDLGGETVGTSIWPPMGSGQFASGGFGRAAYHRAIKYRNETNAALTPSLIAVQPWPRCQTTSAPTWGGTSWQTYFFFGGAGGKNC